MAKVAREQAVRERRSRKQEKRDAKKLAAAQDPAGAQDATGAEGGVVPREESAAPLS